MRNNKISFASVLKDQSRSPQPMSNNRHASLADYLEQWEQYPDQQYTLYLGNFTHSFRSHHSSNRMYSSKLPNEDEQMFDSWIQRQSAINANKQNYSIQPRRGVQENSKKLHQGSKVTFSSKIKEASHQRPNTQGNIGNAGNTKNEGRRREAQKPIINFKQLQNIGGNIKMIKSNTCETEEIQERNVIEPARYPRFTAEDMEESRRQDEHEKQSNPIEQERQQNYQNHREEQISKPSHREKQIVYQQKIDNLIEDTKNNLHHDVIDLARQFVGNEENDPMRQSVQSQNVQQEEEEEEELLIGGSDRKPLGENLRESNMFSQDYLKKKREEEEEKDRKRKEDAKNKINSLFHKTKPLNINTQPMNFNGPQEVPQVLNGNANVGYSFASNPIETPKIFQFQQKQSTKIDHIPEIKSELPSLTLKEPQNDETDFRKKYVREDSDIKNIQSVQYSIQQEEPPTVNVPNSSFEAKLINNEEKHEVQKYELQEKQYFDRQSNFIDMPVSVKEPVQRKQIEVIQEKKTESVIGYQTNKNVEHERGPNQKIKIYSSNKRKNGNSSNKSSPAAGQSPQERQQLQKQNEVKTNPFTTMIDTPVIIKEEQQHTESDKEVKGASTPFEEIKSVPETKINNYEPSYGTKTTTYNAYALPSQVSEVKSPSTGKYNISTGNYTSTFTTPQYSTSSPSTEAYYGSKPSETSTYQFNMPSYTSNYRNYSQISKKEEKTSHTIQIKEKSGSVYPEKKENDQKSYLSGLELKESINVDEPKVHDLKPKYEEPKKVEVKSILDKQLKQSLKQSINMGNSGQFVFDL